MTARPASLSAAVLAAYGILVPGCTASAQPAAPPSTEVPTPASVARQFALSYLNFWSAPNPSTLVATPVFYAPRIVFHGRSMTSDALFAEKLRFVARWPDRTYTPRVDTMRTTCLRDVCKVRTAFDFSATNSEASRHSEGRGALELAIKFVAGRPYIVEENSRVTHRGSASGEARPARPSRG
jgi:hypothetical protein